MTTETISEAARRLGIKGQEGITQIRRMIRRLLDKHDTAARLFLDPATGQPKPVAAKWFRQLAADNFVNGGAWHADAREHAYREGRRDCAQDIIRSARLDAERLDALIELERTST